MYKKKQLIKISEEQIRVNGPAIKVKPTWMNRILIKI